MVQNAKRIVAIIITSIVVTAITVSIICVLALQKQRNKVRPNVIFILADDLGWNDVGFHGSNEIPTPNIDALAYSGVILNNYYVQPMCSPSRSALMTGKHPIRTGLQHDVILTGQPDALPLNEKILPEYLKENGYRTHIVGKWHLGFHKEEYLPTNRGFDSHFGYWPAYQDYYKHIAIGFNSTEGHSMRRNLEVAKDVQGNYSTYLFTNEAVNIIKTHKTEEAPLFLLVSHLAVHSPLEAPEEVIEQFSHIEKRERRIYAAMAKLLDDSVGGIMKALRESKMADNTIVVFSTDNGGDSVKFGANNFPLRGQKTTLWQGGVRGVAAVWSPLLKNPRRVSNEPIYIGDWLKTLCTATGSECQEVPADSKDCWAMISKGTKSPRSHILLNLDPVIPKGALIKGDYKIIYGRQGTEFWGEYNDWYDESNQMSNQKNNYSYQEIIGSDSFQCIQSTSKAIGLTEDDVLKLREKATVNCKKDIGNIECVPVKEPCLFNLRADPCERINLRHEEPDVFESLWEELMKYNESVVQPRDISIDPEGDPKNWDGIWQPWFDLLGLPDVPSLEQYKKNSIHNFLQKVE